MLAPLGPGHEDKVKAASGLDERPRHGMKRELEVDHEVAAQFPEGTSAADAQDQTDWTDTTRT